VKQAMVAAGVELEGTSPAAAQAYFLQQRDRMSRLSTELKISLKN
jgi:hypothetical protein